MKQEVKRNYLEINSLEDLNQGSKPWQGFKRLRQELRCRASKAQMGTIHAPNLIGIAVDMDHGLAWIWDV